MKILVIDDEKNQREIIADILTDADYQVTTAAGGEEGLQIIYRENIPLVLTDLKMPGKDGLVVLKETLDYNPNIQVILMTAFGTIPSAVTAIKNGAYDYLSKPFKKEELLQVIRRAEEKIKLMKENRQLKEEINQRYSYHQIIGRSKAIRRVFHLIEKVKDIDTTVLITGESGTGKELVGRAIHTGSKRNKGPFIAINCGAIPEMLIESELFGHQKGSFTGAVKTYQGRFEQAQNGTIFLDEIGVMPLSLQVRLLRVVEEKKIVKVGGQETIDLNVRVIAATNEDLQEKIKEHKFRTDLFHRINVFNIHLPPLRERKDDIALLTRHFINKYAAQYNRKTPRLSSEALEKLEGYSFPGNVRELENIIDKTIILCDGEIITAEMLMIQDTPKISAEKTENSSLPQVELQMIRSALKGSRGSIKLAAEKLGISYKTMQYRIKKFGLDKKDFK